MIVLGCDPGTEQSAIVLWNGQQVHYCATMRNDTLLTFLREGGDVRSRELPEWPILVIEKFESMGMAVGMEVFETVYWSGRFHEAYANHAVARLSRHAVKLHLCGNKRATDTNIRTALMDRFGGARSVGTKANPGPLYGVTGHGWAALGVAVSYFDGQRDGA